MNENKVLDEATGSQTEAVTSDPIFGMISAMANSPGSDDSGMAGSPISVFDGSMPSSPASPRRFEQEFYPNHNGNPGILDSCVEAIHSLPAKSENLQIVPSSPNPDSPSIMTQTKGVDEGTIQKMLQLLKANRASAENTLLSNLLINILGNSTKKNSVLQCLLSKSNESENVESRKRPSYCLHNDTASKEPKIEVPIKREVPPSIVILEQPEKNYRARYESEGCRGPVHGSSDMTFPTIQVEGYSGHVWVTIHLATNKGTPHFHLLCGPGSTKLPCRNIELPNNIPAIQVLVSPESGMTAVLDCISLKRRRNFEADKELKRRGLNPADWKSERKEACFVFTAEIPTNPSQVVTCKSRVFQCTAPPGNPEIWWMKPVKGSVLGGEEIGLIGKKFPKGCKVRFFGDLPSEYCLPAHLPQKLMADNLCRQKILEESNSEKWEAYGDVDKTKSNTGAAVVLSPCLPHPITCPLTVNVEVCNCKIKGNNYISSDSMDFSYLPVEKPPCKEEVTFPSGLDILPENLDLSELIDAMSQYLPAESNEESVTSSDLTKNEWEQILLTVDQLHRNGGVTMDQFKELKSLVILQDTILLQAFRSTRDSVSENDFLVVFCQYLAGMTIPSPL